MISKVKIWWCNFWGHKHDDSIWKGSVLHNDVGPCNVYECQRCEQKYLRMMV